ncbi:MAG: hypothetical protein RMI78_00765 [Nitrososphaerota archaeon]|nr:hypothetical protein [Nitrososphaerota archaeon]
MKTREWIILVLIITAASSFTFSYFFSHPQVVTQTVTVTETINIVPVPPDGEYEEGVRELLRHVMEWVESRRGLSFKEEVDVVILTREWVVQHWGVGSLNLTETRLEERLLKSLFMIPWDFNLTEFKVGRAGYIVAASAGNTVYIVKEEFNPDNELRAGAILVHELMHILQGEYFDLPDPSTSDEGNAFDALIEGEAGLISSQYISEHGEFGGGLSEGDLDPLTALWLFPYIHGRPFVEYVHEKGGWDGVNEIYEDPPRSTAEILHPEKYSEGWRPVKPSLPPEIGGEWRLVMQDTLGEYFIRQMFRAHLPSSTANMSAEGWRGDVVQIYEKGDAYVMRWKIVWEDSEEAMEFLEAFKGLLREVDANQASANSWTTEMESIMVEVSGAEVLIEIISPPMKPMEEAINISNIQNS